MITPFELNQSQQAAVIAFSEWLVSDEQVFLLKGAAGTGKTTLVSEFIKILVNRDNSGTSTRDTEPGNASHFALMAPTGRAAYILSQKTGYAATTIHKGIYKLSELKRIGSDSDDSDDVGMHAHFAIKNNNDAPRDTVYIIDESSMVANNDSENEAFSFGSGRLMSDLFTFAQGRKILFVGDYAQLPPVGMNFSPALDKDYIRSNFHCNVREFILREVMRQQNGSVILDNASRIRDSIEAKTFFEFRLYEGEGSTAENEDLLRPYFRLAPDIPSARCAIITHSNQQALKYNLAVRRQYLGEHAPRLIPGDLLMVARNNYSHDYELFNGNIVKVESCDPDSVLERRSVRVRLTKGHVESVELRFRKAAISFNAGGKAVSMNVTILDNFLDDPSGSIGGLLSRALIVDFEHRLPKSIKKGSDEYLEMLRQDRYYNSLVCKYGYAMTCHKAQGGEWDNVFVDMCRFGGTSNEDYFRWAYTALTRASKHVWHFRAPDFNYISNMVVEPVQRSTKIRIRLYSKNGDFLASRLARISRICAAENISVRDDREISYQQRLYFSASHGHFAGIALRYNDTGYSGKTTVLSRSSDSFLETCTSIADASFAPDDVPFSAPDRPFAEKLTAFIKELLPELGIKLLDITQELYEDILHLKTDGLAKVCLHYNAKGHYTYMKSLSSLGSEDKKLEALRQRFL